jgi:hypothetical protein
MYGLRVAALVLATALASVPLDVPGLTATAQASEQFQRHGNDDHCFSIRTRDGRERICVDRSSRDRRGGDWGDWGERDRGRWGRDWGDSTGWRRARHEEWGDCFRTPWGRACETDTPGVFRVRDRHRGDEAGPDCDLLLIQPWGWQCYDSPFR